MAGEITGRYFIVVIQAKKQRSEKTGYTIFDEKPLFECLFLSSRHIYFGNSK